MKEIVLFFWTRWHRAWQMDEANKLSGLPTPYSFQSIEWTEAYKNTLSKNKQSEFDKEWNRLEQSLADFQDGKKGAVSPFK